MGWLQGRPQKGGPVLLPRRGEKGGAEKERRENGEQLSQAQRWPQGGKGPQFSVPGPHFKLGWLLGGLKLKGRVWLPRLPLLSLPHPLSPATWHLCAPAWGSMIPDLGAGEPGKVWGMWSLCAASSLSPTAPGRQGGGAVSLRAFRLLGADGQADRGPLSFVWLCTKEGASWGGGSCSRWEGGALPLPPSRSRRHCPWGAFSL